MKHSTKRYFDMRTFTIFASVFFLTVGSIAQESLTFEAALASTLENNYSIRISRVNELVSQNNASKAANGYLPGLSASGSYAVTSYQGTNSTLTGDQHYDANASFNYNAGVTLSYTLFDGQGRKYRYQQAQGTRVLSELELRSIIENTVILLSERFYEVARLEEQNAILSSTLSISKQRLKRSKYGLEYGQSSQLDILNAEVDLNTDSINVINSRLQLNNGRRNLNLIMGVDIETSHEVLEAIELRKDILTMDVVQIALDKGVTVLTAEQVKQNSEWNIRSLKSSWYPNLGVYGGYQYRGSDDPNGAFLTGSESFGPTAGVNFNWNIFNGSNKTRGKNASLQLESSTLALNQIEEQVKANVLNALGTYQNALFILEAREGSVTTARRNYGRSQESFNLGQITSLEFRQAQVNLLNAELLQSQALYDAKRNELQVLALLGELVK